MDRRRGPRVARDRALTSLSWFATVVAFSDNVTRIDSGYNLRMNKPLPWFLLLTTLSIACSSSTSSRVSTIGGLKGDATAGKTVYTNSCSSCHGSDAKSGSARENLPSKSASAAYAQIIDGEGSMPSFADLSDQSIANVWAYVQTLK